MKKILFILLFLPVFAVAQWPAASPRYYATLSKVEEALTSLSTVADISTFTDTSANTIVVTDTVRGGTFIKYTGANAADNGVIFQDGNGQKWKRVSDNNYVNLAWFGAKPDGSDCRAYFLAAINSALNNLTNVRIRVPASAPGDYYFISDSVLINNTVYIFGDGPASKLRFAQHKKSFVFAYPGSQYSRMEDLTIEGVSSSGSSPSTWDSTKHGIVVKAPVYFKNIWVYNFDACGIYIVNDLTAPVPGNSSTSVFDGCHVYSNLLHGIYIQGSDANAMTFRNCDAVANGGVGFYSKSFLGISFYDNHAASNGSPEISYQRGLVKYNGVVYACIKDTTINQLPTNTTYWQNIGTDFIGYAYVQDYSASKVYWAVSSYILEGANQHNPFVGNYAELDQAPGFIDGGNIDVGNNVVWRNSAAKLYANLGRLTSNGFFSGDNGIGSSWIYGGNMESYITPTSLYPNYSGFIAGGYTKGGLIDFRHNNTKVGEISTTATRLNITADTTNVIGVLYNNGSAVGGGSPSFASITGQPTDNTNLATALAGKQATLGYTPLNPANNLSEVTASTARTNLGIGNIDNTSDATKNAATATFTNKTFNLSGNTLTGTKAQFNTALSDGDFATQAGIETITNKTIDGLSNTVTNVTGEENVVSYSAEFLAAATTANPPFVGAAISSGTNAANTTNMNGNHPGLVRMTSSTTANGGYKWQTDLAAIRIKGGEVFTAVIAPINFATTTVRIGFHDASTSTDAVDGAYFEYSTSGAIVLKTASNSTRTTSSTITTLSANTWYKLKITVNSNATSVLGEVFDASGTLISSATNTTNIPTAAGRETGAGIVATESSTTATAMIDLDFLYAKFSVTR